MSTPLGIDISQILQPLLLSAVIKGEDIGPIIDIIINDKINETILDQILASVQIPSEFADIVDVLRLAVQLDNLKATMAALRGETYTPRFTIDKLLELVVSLQMVSALSTAVTAA